jgi:hypothetical protein
MFPNLSVKFGSFKEVNGKNVNVHKPFVTEPLLLSALDANFVISFCSCLCHQFLFSLFFSLALAISLFFSSLFKLSLPNFTESKQVRNVLLLNLLGVQTAAGLLQCGLRNS